MMYHKSLLAQDDHHRIGKAIRDAELETSGSLLQSTVTLPWDAARSAKLRPATPLPTTRKSVCVIKERGDSTMFCRVRQCEKKAESHRDSA